MYIKKKDREIINFIDRSLILPKGWKNYVRKQTIKHNLIIKDGKTYRCTFCNNIFESTKRINDNCKCPSCKNIYLVKSAKLKYYDFKSDLAIFDKVQDHWVERLFRLESFYSNKTFKVTSDWCEWGRNIYDYKFNKEMYLNNSNVFINISNVSIHNRTGHLNSDWKIAESYYSPNGWIDEFNYYPGNLKKILTPMKKYRYSQLWVLVCHTPCDLIYLLKNYNQSIEMLTKMKMYNLALNPKSFKNKKLKDYGLTKSYIPFIRKHNLTIDELEALSIFKKKNVSLIRKISSLNNYHTLSEIVDLEKAFHITDLSDCNSQEYYDYLITARLIGRNMKDKKVLYPQYIMPAHNEVMKEYEIQKDQKIKNGIKHRYNELKKNIYQNNQYIITPADSMASLIDESKQQNNCVRTYAERYAKKECDIYFMRKTSDPAASLVTVEVKNKEVVQQRTKNNESTNKSQMRFLKVWENKILKGVKNET